MGVQAILQAANPMWVWFVRGLSAARTEVLV